MSDQAESLTEAERRQEVKSQEDQKLGAKEGKGDISQSTRVRTVSEGYCITEEQEMTLLAGEDGEDLDVIECFVDDYDSDMEEEIRRKDVKKVELQEQKPKVEVKASKVEVLQVVHIVRPPMEESESTNEEHDEPLAGNEEEAPQLDAVKEVEEEGEEDEDEDVIQIVVENADDLLEEAPAGCEKVEEPPKVSVHVSDDTENERILSKPLVKQVVMDVSVGDDEEDELKDQHGGAGSPKSDDDYDQTDTPIGTQEDSDAEQPLVIADSVEANVGAMSGSHQEDPDVLQLKLDLHQNMGEMDYEPDDDDHRDSLKDEERLERSIQIKEEPMSPIKDRLERILLDVEDIPTIELSSDDDFVELPPQKSKKGKKGKSKKKSKHSSKSECSVSDATPITVEESLPSIKSTTSSKSLHSNDSMVMDAELLKTGFRMELRKRKSATRLEENGTPPSTRKLRNTVGKSDDYRTSIGQSKSRASIILIEDDIPPEKPPKKKTPSQKPFQPVVVVSTVDKRKINSLSADCEKSEVVPASIFDDGMPLLDKDGEDLFGKTFKSRQPVKKHASAAAPIHRQTMFIDALPRATVKSGHHTKSGNEQPSTSKPVQKPKVVQEIRQQIIHELEDDLAMSSSDEDTPLRQKLVSAKGIAGSPASKKPGRKRGRAPKQHIEDYFCPSPVSKKDSTETPVIDVRKPQPQVKRRKKRSRISSYSTNSEDETTESISLPGTISTITANRSVTTTHEEEADHNEPLPVEPKPPKTDNLSIVVSPLTKEEIAKRSKCITPKKVRALSKASQTELEGLSWRIDLNQIDFHSEYFEKLYQLIKNGRELRKLSRTSNNFEGVVIVGRDVVRPPTPPERSPQRPPAAVPNGRARSNVEQLLFERADEVEYVTTARVEPSERERMERSIRTNFRIPKIAKQSSRSPQDVTSSTHHDNDQQLYREDEGRQSSSGGYSNDRHVTPDPRRHITVGSRSPLRVENALNSNAVIINRPVMAAPAAPVEVARSLPPIRRTIRNENVQPPVVAPQQPQPVDSGYPAYRPQPEQAPPQYQANVFQQQPQIPPQQQQLGAYMASGQEMDVKPNISAALTPQATMLGPGMMNRSSIFDSFQFMCQLTMMQMMQQQLQFPTMNAGGQMFSGPSVVPPAASACNPTPAPVPPMPPVQMMPPPAVQQDEVSEQITQIFGCIDHLKGRCIKNPCQYLHTLPTEATLRQMLQGSAQDVVMTTYHFIVGQDNLFMRYFPVYTEVMGRRNMRHQLIDAVSHCEQSKRAFPYYRFIVEGLTISGTLTRSKAVQLVLEKHRKISFDQIHVLISLILDTGDDVPQFLQWLDQFSQVQDYQYEIPSINRLLKCCVRSARSMNAPLHGTVADVAKLTFRLVMSVATGKEPFVDTDTLIEYAELLMRSNLDLDHEKLMHKYGKNELASSVARH